MAAAEGGHREAAASLRRAAVMEGPDGLFGGRIGAAGGGVERGLGQFPSQKQPSPPLLPPLPPPPPPPLSRLAALRWEDIEGRRILLHVDLSTGVVAEDNAAGGGAYGGEGGGGVAYGLGRGGGAEEPFPDAIRLVAEQVRQMLSAKPAAVAIVSETAPSPLPDADEKEEAATPATPPSLPPSEPGKAQTPQQPASASGDPGAVSAAAGAAAAAPGGGSLRASAAAVASLLGIEVDFYDTVPELAAVLERCAGEGGPGVAIGGGGGGAGAGGDVDGGGALPPFGMVPLMMAERLSLPGVVPAPPVEEPELSDGEEERLPDFSWRGEGGRVVIFRAVVFRAACFSFLREMPLDRCLRKFCDKSKRQSSEQVLFPSSARADVRSSAVAHALRLVRLYARIGTKRT